MTPLKLLGILNSKPIAFPFNSKNKIVLPLKYQIIKIKFKSHHPKYFICIFNYFISFCSLVVTSLIKAEHVYQLLGVQSMVLVPKPQTHLGACWACKFLGSCPAGPPSQTSQWLGRRAQQSVLEVLQGESVVLCSRKTTAVHQITS